MKDLSYFMRRREQEIVEAPGPETFVDENGERLNLEIRVLDQAAIENINDGYRKRTIALNKRGEPYIANGEVVYKVEKDTARAMRHIVAEALAYPDLKNEKMLEFYNCVDITEMPRLVFSRSDEYNHVIRVVWAALGLSDAEAESDDDAIEEQKN